MSVTFATFQPLKSLVKALAPANVRCGRGAASGHCVARAGGAGSRGATCSREWAGGRRQTRALPHVAQAAGRRQHSHGDGSGQYAAGVSTYQVGGRGGGVEVCSSISIC